MKSIHILTASLLAMAALLAGCAEHTPSATAPSVAPVIYTGINTGKPASITSNKAPDYKAVPRRMFVLTDIGTDFGEEYGNAFQESFVSIIKNCNVDSEVSRVAIYDRSGAERQQRITEYNPDMVLIIKRNGGTARQSALISVIYDVKLIDTVTNTTVWRAAVNYDKGDFRKFKEHGQELASELIAKMKSDQLLGACK